MTKLIKSKERVRELAEVYTPPELVNEMLDRLPKEQWEDDKTFLDPACGSGNMLLEVYRRKMKYKHDPYTIASTTFGIDIMEDNVVESKQILSALLGKYIEMFSPDCISATIMKKDCNKIIDKNIQRANSLEVDWSEIFRTKFSTVITNPPYLSKQMVYLKFLKKAQSCAEHVLGLHPATPFLDQRKKNKWTDLINTFSKELDYIKVINSKNAFPDVDIQALLCITYWKTHSNRLIYENNITDVKQIIPNGKPDLYTGYLGYDDLFAKFWHLPKEDSIADWAIKKKHTLTEGFVVELSLVRGNTYKNGNKKFFKPDIFSFNPKNTQPKPAAETQSSNKNKFWFPTLEEAENFCYYLDTNFARATLGIVKRDYNPKYTKTPKIPLDKKYTDDELYSMFCITEPERIFIDWLITP